MYMETMKFQLKSATPLLFNRRSFMLDVLQNPELRQVTKPKEEKLAYEMRICNNKAYINAAGMIEIPSSYFMAGFKESQKNTRCPIIPKGAKKGTLGNYLSALLVETISTQYTEKDLKPFATIVCLSTGFKKTSMPCVRPQLMWEGELSVISTTELVTLEQVQPMVEYVGRFLGIGDYTPRCGGQFGRFNVVKASSSIS
jgi:hypothetical protein